MFFSMENGPTLEGMELALMRIPEEPKVPEWTKKDEIDFQGKTEVEIQKHKQEMRRAKVA